MSVIAAIIAVVFSHLVFSQSKEPRSLKENSELRFYHIKKPRKNIIYKQVSEPVRASLPLI